jgi:hydroxymethylglutaryl-CoA lyase
MEQVYIHEVGLRDGLQMEKVVIPTKQKAAWVEQLLAAKVDILQLGSFVHPEKMPQMADTDELIRQYTAQSSGERSAIISGLVLNEKGMERGMQCGVELFCLGVSASETHSMKNTRMSVTDATRRIITMAKEILASGKQVQASIQSAFGCGFEGRISEDRVIDIARQYVEAGIPRISLADTAGHADPEQVKRLCRRIKALSPQVEIATHFHNTYGMALANAHASLAYGATVIETAFGGLGGCPFTKQPAGNLCTEDFVHYLHRIGKRKDVDLDQLIELARNVAGYLNRSLPGYVYKAGPIRDTP